MKEKQYDFQVACYRAERLPEKCDFGKKTNPNLAENGVYQKTQRLQYTFYSINNIFYRKAEMLE